MSARSGLRSAIVIVSVLGACLAPPVVDVAPTNADREVVYLADTFGRVVMRDRDGSLRIVEEMRSRGPGGTSWIGHDSGVGLLAGTTPYSDRVIVDRFALSTGEVTGRFDVEIPETERLLGAPLVTSLDGGRSTVLARTIVDGFEWRTRLERYVIPNDLDARAIRPTAAWTAVDDDRSFVTVTALAADRLLVTRVSADWTSLGRTAHWTLLDGRLREIATATNDDPGRGWLAGCAMWPSLVRVDASTWATACRLWADHWGILAVDPQRLDLALVELAPGVSPFGTAWHGAGEGRVNVIVDGPGLGEVDLAERTSRARPLSDATARFSLGVLVAAAKEPFHGVSGVRFGAGGRFAFIQEQRPEGTAVTVIDTQDATYRTVAVSSESRDPHSYWSASLVGGSDDGRRFYALDSDGVRATLLRFDTRTGLLMETHDLPAGRGPYEVLALVPAR